MTIKHLEKQDGHHFGRISNGQDNSPNHLKTDSSIIRTIQKLDMSGFRIPIVLDTQILEIFKKILFVYGLRMSEMSNNQTKNAQIKQISVLFFRF